MIKRSFFTLLLLFVSTFSALSAQSKGPDYHVLEELNILIEAGDSSDSNFDAIRARLKSKVGSVFSQEDFDEDLKVLARDFDRVEPDLRFQGSKAYISLHIWPRPLIRCIQWEGNYSFDDGRLVKELGLRAGDVFDRSRFVEGFQKVKAYYIRKGHFESRLNYETYLDPVTHELDITICVDEGRAGCVRNIRFVNFQPVEETALNDMLVTKEFNILTSWMTSEGTVKKEMLQQDEFNILSYIQSRGYADARVRIDIEEVESRLGYPRVDIIITLERGPRYSFGTLSFDGNSVFADEDIHSLFKMEEGGSFSPDAMRDTVRCISDTYGRKGFIDAYVTFEPKLRRSEAVYDVHFHIVEGDQYRVGMIKVYGNTSTYNQVILHETLLIPGEVFNTDKLQKTEQRLRNIGYFECVNVYAVRSEEEDCCDPGAPKFRDVHIEVDERSTGDFTFSFGYSTSEAGFGGLSFSERNFDICGVPCLWDEGYGAIRGGGQYFSARANFGSRNQTYNLSWTEPYWRDTDWAVGVDFDKSHYQSGGNAYAVDAHGAAVHATYTLNQFLKYSWHYRIRHTDVDLGDVRNPSPQLIDEANNSGLISGTGMSLMYDSTNHPAAPSCGFRSRLSAEYVGLGGTHTFFNLGYLNSLYYSPEPCVVMKFRGDARFIAPVGDTTLASLPIDERFFLGGEGSIRGFDHYGIGPRYSNGDPRGGLTLLLCSAEYVWKYFKMADFYTFVDTGTLSAGRFSFEEDWRTSVGLGARLYVFPGGPPLTLGWAWPMNTAPNDKVPESRFFLTLGGRF